MAWLAVDKVGNEWMFRMKPKRTPHGEWDGSYLDHIDGECIRVVRGQLLPKGLIFALLDKELTWYNEPVEILK